MDLLIADLEFAVLLCYVENVLEFGVVVHNCRMLRVIKFILLELCLNFDVNIFFLECFDEFWNVVTFDDDH